uniref:Kynureninase n=1 Tax=Plectus sambesii TaxID=2011161 RepID=A0A914WEL8_9BILA
MASAFNIITQVAAKSNITDLTSFELAKTLDENDELKHLRDEFFFPKMKTLPHVDFSLVDENSDAIYMCGNSLGLQPKGVKKYIDEQLEKWANMGVFGHMQEPLPWALCDEYAVDGYSKLVGAEKGEVVMMNGLTINLHLMMISFYHPTPERHKILLESKAFPSDHYAVESQIKLRGFNVEDSMVCLEPRSGETCLRTEDIVDYLKKEGKSIAMVMFSGLQYYTGQLYDMKTVTEEAQRQGCIVGWDLAHAVGNVPLKLHEWNVDFACWCTYKYTCSSAGGMAGAFVHSKHATRKDDDRLLGWWSHKFGSRFVMDNKLDLEEGAFGYRVSNPPILLVCPLMAILDVYKKTTMEALREKSLLLTGYLEYLLEYYFGRDSATRTTKAFCDLLTPKNPAERGCQLSLHFSVDMGTVFQELVKRGVACDKRLPDVIRIAPVHLYNNFSDVHRFIAALQASLKVIENGN